MYNYIRKAYVKDLERIAEIEIFCYRLNFYPIFRNDEYYFEELSVSNLIGKYSDFISEDVYVYDDGVVKGFLWVSEKQIKKLFVEPVLQRNGIGAVLFQYAVDILGCEYLWVLRKNNKAIKFYESHGFCLTDEKVLEDGTDEYLIKMKKCK